MIPMIFLLCLISAEASHGHDTDHYPKLFITRADVERARNAINTHEFFSEQAQVLLETAREVNPATLPVFDDSWWADNKERPWGETYPEINHLTGEVPRAWIQAIRACTRASLLFPEEGMQAKARLMLLDLSNYRFEYEHYDVGLNYVTWGFAALEAYDILYPMFTPEEHTRLDDFFTRMLEAVQKNHAYWMEHEPGGEMNNHYIWHYLGLMMHGLFFGDDSLVDQALFGRRGAIDSLRYGFRDDGLWLEASISYQLVATIPLLLMAELLDNANYKTRLWEYETDDGRSLKQAYDALLQTLFPDGTIPNLGDCYGKRTHLGESYDFEILYRRFADPFYAWMIRRRNQRHPGALFFGETDIPDGTPPQLSSRVWHEQGYTMLRTSAPESYFSGEGWTLFATWSGAPVHANEDKLSIMVFGDGHHWLVDAEVQPTLYHGFSAEVQRELNRHTMSHNTVMVDNQTQQHPNHRLDLLECQTFPHIQRVTMADLYARLYPGVRQMRTVIITDSYMLDVFQVEADTPRVFSWLAHVNGTSETNSLSDWKALEPWNEGPKRWLRDPHENTFSDGYSEIFRHNEKHLTLDLSVTSNHARVTRCLYPMLDQPDTSFYSTRMIECVEEHAIFVALYRLGAHQPNANLRVGRAQLGRINIEVSIDGQASNHLIQELRLRE